VTGALRRRTLISENALEAIKTDTSSCQSRGLRGI